MTIYNNQVFEDMDLNRFGKAFIKLTSLYLLSFLVKIEGPKLDKTI